MAGAVHAKPVSWEDIANDHVTTSNVLQYGMGTNAQRWSPLAQVNESNVFKLTPAWSFSFGDEKQRGQAIRLLEARRAHRHGKAPANTGIPSRPPRIWPCYRWGAEGGSKTQYQGRRYRHPKQDSADPSARPT